MARTRVSKRPMYYTLYGQSPVPVPQYRVGTKVWRDAIVTWCAWLECYGSTAGRVGYDAMGPGYEVSTVFLGIDHSWSAHASVDDVQPVLFETAICTNGKFKVIGRWVTWADAEAGHRQALALCREQYQTAIRS